MDNPIKMDDLGGYHYFRKHPYLFASKTNGKTAGRTWTWRKFLQNAWSLTIIHASEVTENVYAWYFQNAFCWRVSGRVLFLPGILWQEHFGEQNLGPKAKGT